MSCSQTVFPSSTYYQKWQETEQEIMDVGLKIAGVARIENGEDQLDLEQRLQNLQKLAEYYKRKYEEACRIENSGGSKKENRLRTFNNGL